MLKQSSNKIKKVLVILLAVIYVMSVTAASVSAATQNSTKKIGKHTPFFITDSFSGTPIFGTAPLTVHFKDLSSSTFPITSWLWDFGDGVGTSTNKNPAYKYTSPGTYTVTLKVWDVNGDSGTEVKPSYIRVL